MHTSRIRARARALASTLALSLGLTVLGSSSAAAAVIYDFSLGPNGAVGPVQIVFEVPDFLPEAGLNVLPLNAPPVVSVTSGTPLNLNASVIGVDVDAGATRFGVSLTGAPGLVLLTVGYPNDFFVFNRTPTQTGTFLSTAGVVVSSLQLATVTPVATLVVRQSDVPVPEPATILLLGAAVLGVAARRRRTKGARV